MVTYNYDRVGEAKRKDKSKGRTTLGNEGNEVHILTPMDILDFSSVNAGQRSAIIN